ncbi:MAG TPA: hypothetical protein EYP04_00570 [Anaerolineae bacterium]|nr:hypothetical protein [Anaerolineae bacterium]HIQ04769.1 hypothetical protein [Anaerolineae bacterium]
MARFVGKAIAGVLLDKEPTLQEHIAGSQKGFIGYARHLAPQIEIERISQDSSSLQEIALVIAKAVIIPRLLQLG